jgi:hypothetical protein
MKLPDPPILEKVRQWLAFADEDLRVARHGFGLERVRQVVRRALQEEGLAFDSIDLS